MRHRNNRLRLNKKPHIARMMERNLVTSLVLYENIRTTRKRAKVLQPIIDHLITIAKKQEPRLAIRAINQVVMHDNACRKILEVLRERYATRPGGFTSIKAVGSRKGDGAELVDMTLIAGKDPEPKAAAPKAKKAPAKKAAPKADSSAA